VGDEIRLIDPESSVAYLRIGNRLDRQTMLEALLLPSGNDAAYTIAANVGRIIANDTSLSARAAISVFCNKMNEAAKGLGCENSHFANPDGIHDPNHYTTAADMARIAKHAYNQPLIATVMSEEKVTRVFLSGETGATWYNTNYLLRSDTRYLFEGANGMKTGHTSQAGYCLAASAEQDGAVLIAILMGAEQSYGRFEDATGLFTVCFDTITQPKDQPAA
jgi:D-alanyl-D-alanine carboxypeptidase (penicillin-binding protein 5/6)